MKNKVLIGRLPDFIIPVNSQKSMKINSGVKTGILNQEIIIREKDGKKIFEFSKNLQRKAGVPAVSSRMSDLLQAYKALKYQDDRSVRLNTNMPEFEDVEIITDPQVPTAPTTPAKPVLLLPSASEAPKPVAPKTKPSDHLRKVTKKIPATAPATTLPTGSEPPAQDDILEKTKLFLHYWYYKLYHYDRFYSDMWDASDEAIKRYLKNVYQLYLTPDSKAWEVIGTNIDKLNEDNKNDKQKMLLIAEELANNQNKQKWINYLNWLTTGRGNDNYNFYKTKYSSNGTPREYVIEKKFTPQEKEELLKKTYDYIHNTDVRVRNELTSKNGNKDLAKQMKKEILENLIDFLDYSGEDKLAKMIESKYPINSHSDFIDFTDQQVKQIVKGLSNNYYWLSFMKYNDVVPKQIAFIGNIIF